MSEATGQSTDVVAIIGAGPGNGEAFARRFADAGRPVALLARDLDRLTRAANGIPGAQGFACDVTDPASIAASLD
ncbi:MAG: SDR family NAD(P)-dependent oxidoreductase, partial [Pseudomonadota bacterium]